MQGRRVLYGLGRVPASVALDDPRLPSVRLGPKPLRLNTEPLPADAIPAEASSHVACLEALRTWLGAACGDYAPRSRRFIDAYLAFVALSIERNRASLEASLRRFDGLYALEDWTWSALRPLPRAWLPVGDSFSPVDIAFWDGARLLAVDFSGRGAGIPGAEPAPAGGGPEALFPDALRTFWGGETLPSSPFRRAVPLPD